MSREKAGNWGSRLTNSCGRAHNIPERTPDTRWARSRTRTGSGGSGRGSVRPYTGASWRAAQQQEQQQKQEEQKVWRQEEQASNRPRISVEHWQDRQASTRGRQQPTGRQRGRERMGGRKKRLWFSDIQYIQWESQSRSGQIECMHTNLQYNLK